MNKLEAWILVIVLGIVSGLYIGTHVHALTLNTWQTAHAAHYPPSAHPGTRAFYEYWGQP